MNIRYPIYEGVYRILTKGKGFRTATARISDSAYLFHYGYGYQRHGKLFQY